ncbi:MAG: DUF6457 domain-containing protein [Actinomycetota bacterium]
MDAKEWLDAYAARLGTTAPDEATVEVLLDLAGVAAHSSERTAAPITCWLIGVAGLAPDEALALARELAAEQPG